MLYTHMCIYIYMHHTSRRGIPTELRHHRRLELGKARGDFLPVALDVLHGPGSEGASGGTKYPNVRYLLQTITTIPHGPGSEGAFKDNFR